MASIRERTTKAGVTTWQVLFRHGSRQSSLTFETPARAEDFATLLGLLGPAGALRALGGGRIGPRSPAAA